jgi:methionyl-tRNA formyltransferase
MDKLIIFTSNLPLIPMVLIEATLQAVHRRDDLVVTHICVPNRQNLYHLLYKSIMHRKMQSFLNCEQDQKLTIPWPISLNRLARHYNVKLLIPPDENINHPQFVEHLRNDVKPTMAFSCYCLQKLAGELLDVFEYTANYHNSVLPDYKGIMATGWSVYYGEKKSGFTFHRMNENFDEGAILLQGMLPVRSNDNVINLEFAKGIAASKFASRLLEMMVNRERGQSQTSGGSYFSKKDLLKIRSISDPSKHSSAELMKRLSAFGLLFICVNGRWYIVIELEKMSSSPKVRDRLCFQTREGITMRPARFQCMSLSIFKFIERLVASRRITPDVS